ncbi:MAG: pyrroline-5-carboxylate reductase [Gemmataceae bacterium]
MSELPPLGFIGAGKMATALIRGLLDAKYAAADHMIASDVLATARDRLHQETGVRVTASNGAVLEHSRVVILAVKPQTVPQVLAEIRPLVRAEHVLISVAAGVTLRQLQQGLGTEARLVRVMPNTPCLVGAGACAYSLGPTATAQDGQLVERIFGAVGTVCQLDEWLLDAVTGLSGSGPAYVALVIEALADGGVRVGLPRDIAYQLAVQTVLGAAKMIQQTHMMPATLKDMVASPGGTTIAGLHALERHGVRAAFMDAVQAATQRAQELARAPDH